MLQDLFLSATTISFGNKSTK